MASVPEVKSSMSEALAGSGLRVPSLVSAGGNWHIVGGESQVLVVALKPGEELLCEPGSMLHAQDGLVADAEVGGWFDAIQRSICGGEDLFRGRYINNTKEVKTITLAAGYPGAKLVSLELNDSYQSSDRSGYVIKKGAWTASLGRGTNFGFRVANNLTSGCCSGQGLILSTIQGNGTVFVNGGGTLLECQLERNEKITVDTSALVACDSTVDIGAKRSGTCMQMCCGGEGLFVCELTGPGRVIIQSMPVEKAALELSKFMPKPTAIGGKSSDQAEN